MASSSACSSVSSTGAGAIPYVLRYEEKEELRAFGGKLDEDTKSRYESAYKKMIEAQLDPQEASVDFCLATTDKSGAIFVLPVFEGPVFTHLQSIRCHIYGPNLIIDYLVKGEKLQKINRPIYSNAMEGVVVSYSGLAEEQRAKLSERVYSMNGRISKTLTNDCTHLITTEVGSQKYRAAVTLQLPVLMPDWINDGWKQACTSVSFHAGHKAFETKYRVAPLAGLVITVSGLSPTERKRLVDRIKEGGGRFVGEMRKLDCSHLVVENPEGQKYSKAREWGIETVKKKWVEDSVKYGCCMEESEYHTSGDKSKAKTSKVGSTRSKPVKVSTPEKPAEDLVGFDAEMSVIPGDGGVNITQMSNASVLVSRRPPVSNTTVQETPSVLRQRPAVRQNHTLRVPQSAKRRRNGSTDFAPNVSAVDDLDLSKATTGYFVDSCRILLAGLPNAHVEKLKKLINAGSGTRKMRLAPDVTHVVLGDQPDKAVRQAVKDGSLPPGAVVVTPEWLVDSYNAGKQMHTDRYIHPSMKPVENAEAEPSPIPSKRLKELSIEDSRAASATPGATRKVDADVQALLNSYMDMGGEEQAAPTSPPAPDAQMSDLDNDEEMDAMMDEVEERLRAEQTFANLTFALSLFDPSDVDLVKELITDNGGVLLEDGNVDYLVTPLIVLGDVFSTSTATFRNVVSIFWVQRCIETESLLPINVHPMFRPILSPLGEQLDTCVPKPLDTCVVCLSGFEGCARDSLTYLATHLGAVVQEQMCRKNRANGLLATTHLVSLSATGSKFDAAHKWNLPVLSAIWLIKCTIAGALLPIEQFGLDASSDRDDELWLSCAARDKRASTTAEVLDSPFASPIPNQSAQADRSKTTQLTHSTPVVGNPRIQALRGEQRASHGRPSNSGDSEVLVDTPGKFLDPNKDFKPRFDLKAANKLLGDSGAATPDSLTVSLIERQLDAAVQSTGRAPMVTGTGAPDHDTSGRDNIETRQLRRSSRNSTSKLQESKQDEAKNNSNAGGKSEVRRRKVRSDAERKRVSKEADIKAMEEAMQAALPRSSTSSACSSFSRSLDSNSRVQTPKGFQSKISPLTVVTVGFDSGATSNRPSPPSGVGWDDEQQRKSRELLGAPLRPPDEQTQSLELAPMRPPTPEKISPEKEQKVEAAVAPPVPVASPAKPAPKPTVEEPKRRFMITGISEKESKTGKQNKISKLIGTLGGDLADSRTSDMRCTHLIAVNPVRNEKLLTCMAAGKWILHDSYLDACRKEGRFLKEDAYEWGGPTLSVKYDAKSKIMVEACHFWRKTLAQRNMSGAFDGWKVLLLVDKQREPGMQRLLRAGGAKVYTDSDSCKLSELTYVFVTESGEAWKNQVDGCVKNRVKCLKYEYINSFLMAKPSPNLPPPDEDTFMPADFRSKWCKVNK